MTARMTSKHVVGRALELAELEAAFAEAAAGRPSLAFVAGDSGIGKSRLLAALAKRVRAVEPPARVLSGDCVELGGGELPYAPLVAALRPLTRARDPVLEQLPEGARAELEASLPGAGPAAAGDGRPQSEDGAAQARLFEALLALLQALGAERPVMLAVEDLHWSDRSTRAFLSFLARSLCEERVLVVLTYRSDELHRRHPLRPLLAELERAPHSRRIELQGLTREELTEQLADILGAPPADDLVTRLWRRSEGNPLFTEELLAAGLDGRGALPPTLRSALMLRVERLSGRAQDVLRLIAAGRRLDDALLADAGGLDPRALRDALREAVASQILAAGDDGFYSFRHALLREVVADDLLPGERAELHIALAHAMERRAQDADSVYLAAGIAHHYIAGGDQPAALAACVHAAAAAKGVSAYGEAAELLERALELWERVPDAAALAGADQVDLLRRAGHLRRAEGELDRAESLLRSALELLDEAADPRRTAATLDELARALWNLNRSDEAIAAVRRALALLSAGQPSHERARLLAWMAKARMLQGRYREAIDAAREAHRAATAAGDEASEGVACNALGLSLCALGDVEAGIGELRRAIEIAREHGPREDLGSAYTNLAEALHKAGRTAEGLALAGEGAEQLQRHGRVSEWLGITIAELAFAAGDWRAAAEALPPLRRQVGTSLMCLSLRHAELALGRGDEDAARERLDAISELAPQSTEPQFSGVYGALRAELALREGDVDGAREAVDVAIDQIEFCTEGVDNLAYAAALGVRVEADAAQRARDLGEDPRAALTRADAMLARVAAVASVATDARPIERAWLATAEAERARGAADPDPGGWASARGSWEAVAMPYPAACARWREAEALLAAGDRDAASAAARDALAGARRLGAGWLEREVVGLASRARLRIEPGGAAAPQAPAGGDPFGLTPREQQVLALVARGRTNREIGAELFMAEKTASVHVSRILAKLDVRSRTEAAAVAHRLGLERPEAELSGS